MSALWSASRLVRPVLISIVWSHQCVYCSVVSRDSEIDVRTHHVCVRFQLWMITTARWTTETAITAVRPTAVLQDTTPRPSPTPLSTSTP